MGTADERGLLTTSALSCRQEIAETLGSDKTPTLLHVLNERNGIGGSEGGKRGWRKATLLGLPRSIQQPSCVDFHLKIHEVARAASR